MGGVRGAYNGVERAGDSFASPRAAERSAAAAR
jgi:hypothetical protein